MQAVPRNPRPEDFPELGAKRDRRNRDSHQDREEKENKSRQNYQNDDDNQNYGMRKRNSNRHLNDRRDSDRRDSDRRDNSRTRRHNDRYPSGRGSRNDLDDRRKSKEKGFKNRMGRSTMEFKNQNRNKNSDYDGHGSSGGMYNRNNTGNHSDSRHQQHHHQHDDEHVESISFTNSKLNNNSNRYSNVDYSNIGSIQGREYTMSQMSQEKTMVNFKSKICLFKNWQIFFLLI